MKDFSFQGRIGIAERLIGPKPGAVMWAGDVSDASVTFKNDEDSRKENFTGMRLESATITKGTESELKMTMNYATLENLALGLYGVAREQVGGTVTGEVFPANLTAGQSVVLDYPGVTNLVITDSAGLPVPDTVLRAAYPGSPTLQVVGDVSTFTQPFKAAYTYVDHKALTMFTQRAPLKYLVADLMNTVDGSDARMVLHLYRVKFKPFGKLDLINSNGFGSFEVEAKVLADAEAQLDPDLGPFGRMQMWGGD